MAHQLNLSVQLYSVRHALEEDFDGTLARIADIGFTQVEPFRFTDVLDELRSGLRTYNLTAPPPMSACWQATRMRSSPPRRTSASRR